MIRAANRFRYLQIEDIKCLLLRHGLIEIWHGDSRSHSTDFTLEEVLKTLDPSKFFRINRQHIVHSNAIVSIETYFSGRLKLEVAGIVDGEFIVYRDRTKEFQGWMEG